MHVHTNMTNTQWNAIQLTNLTTALNNAVAIAEEACREAEADLTNEAKVAWAYFCDAEISFASAALNKHRRMMAANR